MTTTTESAPAGPGMPARAAPDPGSRASRLIALVLAVLIGGAVVAMQNVPPMVEMVRSAEAETATETGAGEAPDAFEDGPDPEPAAEPGPAVPPPNFGSMADIMGRLYIKIGDMLAADPNAMPTIEAYAVTDAERARLIVVDAEVRGAEEAVARADELLGTLGDDDPLAEDVRDMRTIYADGADAITGETADRLREHHGYFGKVALTHGLDDDAPARAELLSGGVRIMALLLSFGLLALLAVIAGIGLFFTAIVLAAMGKLRARMPVPAPGGSVFLETFVVFVAGFFIISQGTDLLARWAGPEAAWTGYVSLGAQWLLLLAPLWPLARGMSFTELKAALGWNAGAGFFREVGCGILGYLAGLPVFLTGVVITLVSLVLFQFLIGVEDAGTPTSNPVFELVGSGDPVALVLIYLLATVWAPLCEELVFRGALHRHFRGRVGVGLASLGTAAVFGFMHGYGPLFVFPLIALGTVFSLLREWRGSLVACITAHALHNGTVLTLVISLFLLMGD